MVYSGAVTHWAKGFPKFWLKDWRAIFCLERILVIRSIMSELANSMNMSLFASDLFKWLLGDIAALD